MLIKKFIPTPYDSKHDIACYNLSKQIKRRTKPKSNVTSKTLFVQRNMSDRAKNVKSKKMLHDGYVHTLKYDKNDYDSLCYINTKQRTKNSRHCTAAYSDYKPTKNKYRNKSTVTMDPIDIHQSKYLLISGYCHSFKQVEGISNAVLIDIINLYLDTSSASDSQQTQRAIASANFIGDIIAAFEKRNKCLFVENDKDHINLLQFVYVRGGALRDVLLARDINDIDIVIDTTGLTQVYLQHLLRYHSTQSAQAIDCQCYLWQRYLNLFRKTADKYHTNTESDRIKRFEKHIVSADFLLNARFFKEIIMNCEYNANDAIYAVNTWAYTNWKLAIQKKLLYKYVDLNGANFDIGDEMSNSYGVMNKEELHLQYDAKWDMLFDRLQRECVEGTMNCIYGQYGRDQLDANIDILLPLYTFDMKHSTQYCDFTVNGLRLPLSEIFDGIYSTNQWHSKIFSYKDDHNKMAIHDIGIRVIRQPDLNMLTVEEIYDGYFWRFIKILTKFDYSSFENHAWKMDDNTARIIRGSFVEHFRHLNEKKMKEFIKRLLFWTIDDTLSTNEFSKIMQSRLMFFDLVGVTVTLKNAFLSYPQFGDMFSEIIVGDKKISAAKKRILYRVLSKLKGNETVTKKSAAKANETTKTRRAPPSSWDYDWRQLCALKTPFVKIFTKKKMYKHYKFHDDDNIYKNNYYFNENNLKLSAKVKKKWAGNHKKHSTKQLKRKKKLKKSKKSKQRSHLNVFLKKEQHQNVFAYYVC